MNNFSTALRNVLAFGLLICLVASCTKNDASFLFKLPLRNIDFEIPPTLSVTQVHYFNIDNVPTSGSELFDVNGVMEANAIGIFPAQARMETVSVAENYDFIAQMSIRICEAGDLSQNCGKEIFWRQPVPQNAGSFIDLIPSELNVQEFLLLDKVNIQVKLESLRRNPPQFIETRLDIDFDVR